MEFNNAPPEWENKGAEPGEDLKKQGFLAGYKPPAAYFNWFWNKTSACIKELQEKLKGITKSDVGLDKVDNKSLEEILTEVTMDKANAKDTSGLVGAVQENVKAQQLLDELANRVATKLVEKEMIANNLFTTNENMVLAAPMGKALQDQITAQNENTDKIEQALKENAEGVEELKAPSFDDSGTVDGINSFTDFLNSVKNKMNIFQFFKNFKAGMKFILHTGMIVDNYATKEKGFLPDATLVTALKEQLDEQNNNKLDKTEFDNLQIGGQNLARETNQGNKNWSWSLQTGSKTVESEIIDGINCVKLTKTEDVSASGWNMVYYKNFERNRIKPNTEYVLSFEVKSNKVSSINADLTKTNGTDYLTETSKVIQGKVEGNDTWTKVVFLLKTYSELPTPTDQVIYLRGFNSENGSIHYIRNLMLEEGNKPSSYTPAIEDVQDQINNVQNPTFDDSGTAEGINSFTDFMNSVKSKMNIFQFYRDFKAGMKYVLHTGRLVNNAVTTEEGFALDARMGKTLQDQITEQNNNIDGILNSKTILTDANNAIDGGSYYFNPTALNIPYKEYGMLSVRTACGKAWVYQEAVFHGIKHKFYRMNINDTGWSDWEMYITNNDLPIIESHVINPSGSNIVNITLKERTRDDLIFVANAFINGSDTYILSYNIENSAGNVLMIKLSKSTSVPMRFNIMYTKA